MRGRRPEPLTPEYRGEGRRSPARRLNKCPPILYNDLRPRRRNIPGVHRPNQRSTRAVHPDRTQMIEQLGRVIVGQADVIEQILAAIFTRGHCLLVGVPGLAKTLMVSSISQILDISFKRIQFTPDLMPSDITGTDGPRRDTRPAGASSASSRGRSSPTSSWPTRSTARRPRRRPPCSRPCRSAR